MTSRLLVVLQFVALAAVAAPWNASGWSPWGYPLLAAAALLAGWTVAHNRPGNFGVMPEPLPRTRLVTSGPYACIRHPMYLAVLLTGLGCVVGWRGAAHLVAFVILAVVLHAKALREEALLRHRFAEYADYQRRTRRLVPFVL